MIKKIGLVLLVLIAVLALLLLINPQLQPNHDTPYLALQGEVERPTLAARVISLEVEGPFRVAVINRGHRSGIRVNDGVITPAGVVGRVTAASSGMSKVQFITDPSSGAAAVLTRTRVQGMVVGRGDNRVEMQYVSALADVEPGDTVTSSGLDGIYPGGFMVGTVTRVGDGEGLQKRIEITTAVDFRTLEEVLVLLVGPAEERHGEDGS
jgi:rod shape-determining protein MreC